MLDAGRLLLNLLGNPDMHPLEHVERDGEAVRGRHAQQCPPIRLGRQSWRPVYFVVGEALTNAAKHAGASAIVVRARLADDRLRIEVRDDGRGGADGHWGTGLQGLADRVATLDGRLTVESPPRRGTRLRAEIPCG